MLCHTFLITDVRGALEINSPWGEEIMLPLLLHKITFMNTQHKH